MGSPVRRWSDLVKLLAIGVFLLGAAPPAPSDATDSDERPYVGSGSGQTEAGVSVSTGTAPSPSITPVQTPRRLPRGRAVTPVEFAALKGRAARGELLAPRADDLDAAATGNIAVPLAPTLSQSFDAIDDSGFIPSDAQIAVGPSDLVVAANSEFSVYDTSGNLTSNQDLFTWFSPVLPPNSSGITVYDPWTFYDSQDDRFVLVALGVRTNPKYSRWLVAVSGDSTAAGSWCIWATSARHDGSTQTDNWADYDKAAATSNALILTANMFKFSNNTFQYAKVRYLPKSALYDTTCPGFTYQDKWDLKNSSPFGTTSFTVIPTLNYPGGTTTGRLVNAVSSTGGNDIVLWTTDTAGCCSTAPTLTRLGQITTTSYTMPPDAEQMGSASLIDTGDTRLLNAVFRGNSGLWSAQTTGCNPGGDPTTRACLRWYQLSVGGMSVTQSGTFGAFGKYYYYPAIHADSSSNATLVFNRSSATEFVGIRYTGRRSTDALGTLQGSASLQSGQGCYDPPGINRWGDYNGIAVDTSNSHMWLFSQYAFGTSATCSNNLWQTRVGEVHW